LRYRGKIKYYYANKKYLTQTNKYYFKNSNNKLLFALLKYKTISKKLIYKLKKMLFIKIVFWSSLIVIFYSYLGYGILIWLYLKVLSLFSKKKTTLIDSQDFEPDVTILVATFNEELIINEKIENTFQISYPAHKLKIIFVADGSSDNTVNIIRQYPAIELYYKPEREGKSAAINRVMPYVSSPFTIFCDANTLLNKDCVKEIVKHYKDPKIGAVAGEKKVVDHSLSKVLLVPVKGFTGNMNQF